MSYQLVIKRFFPSQPTPKHKLLLLCSPDGVVSPCSVRWFKVMIQSITQSALSYPPPHTKSDTQAREQGRMVRCIPSNLIDIQAPLRPPAENFARCYNYFSNLEFMRMFYCSVVSYRLLIYRLGIFQPAGHFFSEI